LAAGPRIIDAGLSLFWRRERNACPAVLDRAMLFHFHVINKFVIPDVIGSEHPSVEAAREIARKRVEQFRRRLEPGTPVRVVVTDAEDRTLFEVQ
jgi:hypothetical protein